MTAGRRQRHARSLSQWPEELPDRDVEPVRRFLEHDIVDGQTETFLHPFEAACDCVMADADALRPSGGAGGIDHIGEVLRRRAWRGVRCALFGDHGPIGVEPKRRDCLRQTLAQMLLGQDERRRGVGDHVGDAVSRIVRIDGQIGAAGLQHAEQSDDHLEGALDAKADDHIRADAERLQMMRQPIGAFVQLAIGELRAFIDQRDSLRVPRRLRLEHLVQKPVLRIVRRGVVPFHQQAMAFVLRQNVHSPMRRSGSRAMPSSSAQ
ncbi:hypothetical+protein [Methylocapsa aurea]